MCCARVTNGKTVMYKAKQAMEGRHSDFWMHHFATHTALHSCAWPQYVQTRVKGPKMEAAPHELGHAVVCAQYKSTRAGFVSVFGLWGNQGGIR